MLKKLVLQSKYLDFCKKDSTVSNYAVSTTSLKKRAYFFTYWSNHLFLHFFVPCIYLPFLLHEPTLARDWNNVWIDHLETENIYRVYKIRRRLLSRTSLYLLYRISVLNKQKDTAGSPFLPFLQQDYFCIASSRIYLVSDFVVFEQKLEN